MSVTCRSKRCMFAIFLLMVVGILYVLPDLNGTLNRISEISDIFEDPSRDFQEFARLCSNITEPTKENYVHQRIKTLTGCVDKHISPRIEQRGQYMVLYNYVRAQRRFSCYESVTYTTHADYSFMGNIIPVVERWQGPISIALHAPGEDFNKTLDSIAHLLQCTTADIKEFVTFHIYFHVDHFPYQVPKELNRTANCSLRGPYENVVLSHMYKVQKDILYPINVGRNIARETAQTYYVFASDVELYPTPNLIPNFLEMIARNSLVLQRNNPKVFPLHVFEVNDDQHVPRNKTDLQRMLKNGTAIPFHLNVCPKCHTLPKSTEWMSATETEDLDVYHVGKRTFTYSSWEPFFIATVEEPLYDERLSWEGMRDKMTQAYILCVLNYDFMILNNAFLVHKPGIKYYKKDPERQIHQRETIDLINNKIRNELTILYGERIGCSV